MIRDINGKEVAPEEMKHCQWVYNGKRRGGTIPMGSIHLSMIANKELSRYAGDMLMSREDAASTLLEAAINMLRKERENAAKEG